LALTGEISSDDFMIDLLLEDMKVIANRNKTKWDKKTEANRQKRITEQQLDVIAELYLQGMKQKDIAAKIGTTP
jgi:DNA-binding NarL/FixJ family response regulator